MSELNELAKALVAFQKTVPTVGKTRTARIPTKNGGEYTYKYADLADIQEAIKEPLSQNGLAVTQFLIGGSDGYTGIQTIIWHESGQSISGTTEVPTDGKTAQEAGSLFTYYKRYALGAALGISTEDDDDGQAGNSKPQAKPVASSTKPASDKQLEFIRSLAEKAGFDKAGIQKRLTTITTAEEASAAIETLQDLIDKTEFGIGRMADGDDR